VGRASLAVAIGLAVAVPAGLAAGRAKTRRVDVSSSGAQAKGGFSSAPSGEAISANGRFVAFASNATNLVPGDMNGNGDVFVRDLKANKTRLVSVSSKGKQGNQPSFRPSISADGRSIAFVSDASNLVHGASGQQVFVRNEKTHRTSLVSASSSGQVGNSSSFNPSISADGRYVAFASIATNLVPGGTSGEQVFLHDMKTGKTILVAESSSGHKAADSSFDPSNSADGHFVAFASDADNLVSHDLNGREDVFVRDVRKHATLLVSVSSTGQPSNGFGITPSISAGGRFVAFESDATSLVKHDKNGQPDVFVRDLRQHTTRLVSVSSSGHQGNNASFLIDPAITPDGRFVAFTSFATNLVAGGTSGEQVFLRDMKAGKTALISQNSSGHQGNGGSFDGSITSDGSLVAFTSLATNLVRGDTNGFADVFVRGPLR
jgi:Tol biopolymer transport system component